MLTSDLVAQIVKVFATFPTWSAEQVYQHLRHQGVAVTQAQVAQAAEQSGWRRLRQTLLERYDLDAAALRLLDEWLSGWSGRTRTGSTAIMMGTGASGDRS